MRVSISRSRRLLVAAPCVLAAISIATVGLSGCGSGGKTLNLGSGGSVVGLGRAAKLIGSWSAKQTLADGKTEETTLDFAPGSTAESVTGSYTVRALSPRADGGSDFVSYESGTLTGHILENGNLSLTFTPDDGVAAETTRAAGKLTRAAGTSQYSFGASGRSMTNVSTGASFNALQQQTQTFQAQSIAGTWTGTPTGVGGFQLISPKDGSPVGSSLAPISIQYATTDSLARNYTASLTLTDPSTGKPYTATGLTARLFSQADSKAGKFPANLSGSTVLLGDELFVSGSGKLPASAGSLPVPGLPISVPLAGRAFVFEASVAKDGTGRGQLGALWLKFDAKTDPVLYPLLTAFSGQNTDATGGYILAGDFYVVNGTTATPTPTPTPTATPTPKPTPTPTPTPTPGSPAVGTVQFSNVVGSNGNTTNMTNTDAVAEIQTLNGSQYLNATLTDKNSTSPERDLTILIGLDSDLSSVTVGRTYPISPAISAPPAGTAAVGYYETPSTGIPNFWTAQSGSVVVTARSGNVITFSVVNAAMQGQANYGTTATGTFTVNSTGKYTVK